MPAFAITNAIKDLIERHVDARVNLVQDVAVGDTTLYMQRADEYRQGETIVLKSDDKAQMLKIACVTNPPRNEPTITVC